MGWDGAVYEEEEAWNLAGDDVDPYIQMKNWSVVVVVVAAFEGNLLAQRLTAYGWMAWMDDAGSLATCTWTSVLGVLATWLTTRRGGFSLA